MKKSFVAPILLILFSLVGLFLIMVVLPSQKQGEAVKTEKHSMQKLEQIESVLEIGQVAPQDAAVIEEEIVDLKRTELPETAKQFDESQMPDVQGQEKIAEDGPEVFVKYSAGKTPEQAWKNLAEFWNDKQIGWDYGIFTEVGKFIRQIYEGSPPEHVNKPYVIHQKGDYAVVSFDKMQYPPFLFCKTADGWKFDLVNQRRLVKEAGYNWGIEKYITPYNALLRRFPVYSRIDIPLEAKDRYSIARDRELGEKLGKYEKLYKSGKLNYKQGLILARLYAVTTLGYRAIPILEQLKEKIPDNPDVYKYLAIAQVDSTLEYGKALPEIKKYTELLPDSCFGHEFLGYVLLQLKDYEGAEAEFKRALEINSTSCYSFANLSLLYKNIGNQENFEKVFAKAQETCSGDNYERVIWLVQLIQREKRSLNENSCNK